MPVCQAKIPAFGKFIRSFFRERRGAVTSNDEGKREQKFLLFFFFPAVDKRVCILYNNGKRKREGIALAEQSGQNGGKKALKGRWQIVVIILLCAAMAVLDFLPVTYTDNELHNGLLSDILPLLLGSVAVIWLMIRGKTGLFGKPVKLLWFLPCLVIAIDNFPFYDYLTGRSVLLHTQAADWLLFALYCAGVGIFEECVFRGILFPLMAGGFSDDRKGFLKTYFLSSVLFGAMHLFNLFAGGGGAAVLQAGYSVLTGGLFAFALIKTKNIFLCAFAHGLYDFCGLVLPRLGRSGGFALPTIAIMAIVSVAVAIVVLYSVFTYPESERKELYARLGFGVLAGKGDDGPTDDGEKELAESEKEEKISSGDENENNHIEEKRVQNNGEEGQKASGG